MRGTECHVYGDPRASSHALILGPVNPAWHGGDFCRPLVDLLVHRRQQVFVLDTIAFIGDGQCTDAGASALAALADYIGRELPHPDVIGGYALGGTVALKLARHLPATPRILSLSGPGFIDPAIRTRLQALVDLLGQGDLAGCLAALSASVAPLGCLPRAQHLDPIPTAALESGCRRMLAGFRFLLRLDARGGWDGYDGDVLCMIGALSQLATTANLALPLKGAPGRKVVQVPDAGMRILLDNAAFTLSTINDWLRNGE